MLPLLAALYGGLRLIAPPAPACPDESAVSAALSRLGDRDLEQDATAEWIPSGEGTELMIRSATASARRVLPAAPCAQLAEMVALAIDRFASPLESPGGAKDLPEPDPEPRRAAEPSRVEATRTPEQKAPPKLELEAGLRVDLPGPAIDVEAAGAWWFSPAWAAVVVLDVPLGTTELETLMPGNQGAREVGSLYRADAAVGARFRPIESGRWTAGLSALVDLEIDWNTAIPFENGQMITSGTSARPLLRADAWAAVGVGRIEFRLTAGARLGPSLTVHAQPLADLTTLNAFDAHAVLSVGVRLGGESR
jgi:hypothetical protein